MAVSQKSSRPAGMHRTRTGAELPWYHLASPRSCERGLVGWCLTRPRAVTGAPVAGSIFTCAARRPSSAQRCLPASILRAFCQAQTMRTLLFSANAIIMFIIRKKSGFVNKNMKKEPSQSKPAGFDSSPEGRAFDSERKSLRKTGKTSPFRERWTRTA